MNNKIHAIIPLKHNSQRVPGKNFRLFCGKPLFFWIIKTLYNCDIIRSITIITDSIIVNDSILTYYPKINIIQRPVELCGDDISVNLLIDDCLQKIDGDFFLQTHVTNPCLKPSTIINAIHMYFNLFNQYDSCFSVNKFYSRFYDENFIPINHDITKLVQTQDLPPVYEDNSCFYIFSRNTFSKYSRRIGIKPLLFPVPRLESLDIDTEDDFNLAELTFTYLEQVKTIY
jgi:CMP-N-acetylneuraminic acid synthetase